MNIILSIGCFLPLFYFLLLMSKKNRQLSDNLLAFLILTIGIHLFSFYLKYNGWWEQYPHLVGLTVPFTFVYAPLMYLYIYCSINNTSSLKTKELIHFLPFAAVSLYMSRFYFFYSAEEKRLVDEGLNHDFDTFTNIIHLVFVVSVIFYVVKAVLLMRNYKQTLDNNYSNIKLTDLKWIRRFLLGFAFVFLLFIFIAITKGLMKMEYAWNIELISDFILVLAFVLFGFYGIRHQNIFVDANDSISLDVENNKIVSPAYENSGLKEDVAKQKHKELLKYMATEKPYLQPKLSLSVLAKGLNISPNYLSQIINQYEQQNFNDFVNKYRINEFIIRAEENTHFSLLALALDSGFNSKSTFNTVFKKHKGQTPSQYLSSKSS